MAYTDLTAIKRRLPNLDIQASTLNEYIDEAKVWIDGVTNTTFEESGFETRIYTPKITSRLVVIEHATQIQKLEVLINRTENGDEWFEIDSISYRAMPENSIPKLYVEFLSTLNYPVYFEGITSSLRVTAKWGYSATPPLDIKRIATQYVVEQLRQDGHADLKIKSERLNDATITFDIITSEQQIQKLEKQLLKYKYWGDIRV